MSKGISRRNLFKMGGVAALGVAGTSALAGCAPAAPTEVGSETASAQPSWLVAPEPIAEFAETKDYDVVVVGAGSAGLPAALTAYEEGASVALLQKESQAISQGSAALGIDLETSDPAGIAAVVSLLEKVSQHRSKRALVQQWAENSGEAVNWVMEKVLEGGGQVISQGNAQVQAYTDFNGAKVNYVSAFFGPKPYTNSDAMLDMAKVVESSGVEVFYSTPAQQLIVEDGVVVGVAAEGENGMIRFNAAKGVILCTGDYQNDEEMCQYYLPDITGFERKQQNKTGDGHKMGCWAGGRIEPIGHTKMLHDFDAGPASMCDMPFMAVNDRGVRFYDESVEMSLVNNYLRDEERPGWYSQIFDSNYMEACKDWPGQLFSPEQLENFMPDVEGEKEGVVTDFIRTFRADTLEELAEKLEIDPGEFVASVERYNEMVANGYDEDFGKDAKWLAPIDTPPFYGIHRWLRVSAITSGLVVDENLQVVNENNEPIPGLFAAGNVSGCFFGGVDYPMTLAGLSVGRCFTQGRVAGRYVANL